MIDKFDPGLLIQFPQIAAILDPASSALSFGGFELEPAPPGAPPAPVPVDKALIILSFTGAIDPLKALGFNPGIVLNGIATGSIALTSIAALAAHPNVVRIHRDPNIQIRLNESRKAIHADLVQQGANGFMGLDGSGVVVGIIDTGFDFRHKAFRKGTGGTGPTRILRLWDQSGQWAPALGYGDKYTETDINGWLNDIQNGNAATLPYKVSDHHGTMCAGIAAGAGCLGSGGIFEHVGIAPKADLMLVTNLDDTYGSFVAEAAAWIATEAQAQNKRAVVNMSLGYTGFACDGQSPMDRLMNALIETYPNLVLVASAGNSGSDGCHIYGDVPGSSTFGVNSPSGRPFLINVWYAPTENFTVEVIPPLHTKKDSFVYNPIAAGGAVDTYTWDLGNEVIFGSAIETFNSRRRVSIVVNSGELSKVYVGAWKLKITGAVQNNSRVHCWVDVNVSGPEEHRARFEGYSSAHTVESPSAADKVIAVGAYITRVTGQVEKRGTTAGQISLVSSRGPLLNANFANSNRLKPDITAPGHAIKAPSNRFQERPAAQVVENTNMAIGTSFASPHVVGVIALLLQKEPALTWQQVYDRVVNNAQRDMYTGVLPGGTWGYGKLDAWATLYPGIAIPNAVPDQNQSSAVASSTSTNESALLAEQYVGPLNDVRERLLQTPGGREIVTAIQTHWNEVLRLIRTDVRVATAWKRSGGPAVHVMLLHLLEPDRPLPFLVYGRPLAQCVTQFIDAVIRRGSSVLRRDLAAALAPLHDPAGRSVNELLTGLQGAK